MHQSRKTTDGKTWEVSVQQEKEESLRKVKKNEFHRGSCSRKFEKGHWWWWVRQLCIALHCTVK